jgi:hypothetical protein
MRLAKFVLIQALLCASAACGDEGSSAPSPSSTEAQSKLIMLAANQVQPRTIALDGESVYWVNSHLVAGGVYKVPKTGGTPVALYEGRMGNVESLALDSANIYFPTGDAILAVPLGGGAPRMLALTNVLSVAVANHELYWFESNPDVDSAWKVSVDGGEPTKIPVPETASGSGRSLVTAAPDAVYVSDLSLVGALRIPLDGDAATRIIETSSSFPEVRNLATDSSHIFFGSGESIAFVTLAGGPASLLTPAHPGGISLYDGAVYFADIGVPGRILRIPKEGGVAEVLAEDQGAPHAIAVDDTGVYWNCINEGTIKKLVR